MGLWGKLSEFDRAFTEQFLYKFVPKENPRTVDEFEAVFFVLSVFTLIIAFCVIFIAFVYEPAPGLFKWSFWVKENNSEIIRNIFITLAAFVGALFGSFQLYNSARRTRISSLDAYAKLEAERNQRFTQSATLLASKDDSLKLAGIYALERLGVEPDAGYAKIVIQTLSAYAGMIAPFDTSVRQNGSEDDLEECGQINLLAQAIVSSISRIWRHHEGKVSEVKNIELRNVSLPCLESRGLLLTNWIFKDCDLYQADFQEAKLDGIYFENCRIKSGKFDNAELKRAEFVHCNLEMSNLHNANLTQAKILFSRLNGCSGRDVDFSRAEFLDASLVSVHFHTSNFRHAVMNGSDMSFSNFIQCNLSLVEAIDSKFSNARLSGTNFMNSDLSGSEFENADVGKASFCGAQISNANLSATNIELAELLFCVWEKSLPPELPEGIKSEELQEDLYQDEMGYLNSNLFDQNEDYIGPQIEDYPVLMSYQRRFET